MSSKIKNKRTRKNIIEEKEMREKIGKEMRKKIEKKLEDKNKKLNNQLNY